MGGDARVTVGPVAFATECTRSLGSRRVAIRLLIRLGLFDLHFLLDRLDLDPPFLNFQTEPAVNVQIKVGDKHEGEEGDDVSTPIIEQEFVAGEEEEKDGDVMAEAVLAGEEIEELAIEELVACAALVLAPLARLAEDFLEDHSSHHAGDGHGQHEQAEELLTHRLEM